MQPKVKLTKRQMKEDKFTPFMLTSKQQFLENWQFYVIGVVILILVVVASSYYFDAKEQSRVDAAAQYAQALADYRNGNTQVAIMSFNQLLEDYSDDEVADQATYLLGKINYDSKNYPEAIRYYEMYVSKFKTSMLTRSAALAGIAASYENQGDYLNAALKFGAACDEYPTGPLCGDYHAGAMRNYIETGDIEKARSHLDIIKEKFGGSTLEARAIRLFSEKSSG
ncbi:MAG: tetratricopeptide repeat protein [candidate division Zixibacteria bacterium]|nr:tetratricopeptide repeat protein [candidate division Zixibacteria bacterium]